MPRRKAKIREEAIVCWHISEYEPGDREYDLIYGVSDEEDFNDLYATSFVTDDTDLLCLSIGGF